MRKNVKIFQSYKYTTKNTIVMSIFFEKLQLSSNWKLVTNLKNEILLKIPIFNFFWYFLSIEHKWRVHMCPLKKFDTRWYYNIHKLSQKNHLKVFGLQRNTTIDNCGGGRGMGPSLSPQRVKTKCKTKFEY